MTPSSAYGAEPRPSGARPRIPVDTLPAWRRTIRYDLARAVFRALLFAYLRPRVRGVARLPDVPYVLCFNHLSWVDPMVLMAVLPARPRLYVYGPREEDLRVGARNRLILWVGTAVPFNPAKTNLLESTRRAVAVLRAGYPLAIAGEGGLSEHEGVVMPLNEGAAFFALRASAPLVPVGISGTRWLRFGKVVCVTVGEPIDPAGRADRETVEAVTAELHGRLSGLVAGATDEPPPGPLGRFVTNVLTHRSRFGRPHTEMIPPR
jgi:1-acyl-sn-glycerol-3-phosphate acyltransferase